MLDILVVAPHPDDAELGMGGSILNFKADGRPTLKRMIEQRAMTFEF